MSLFKQIKIITPAKTELEMTLAGLGSRAYAILIDYHWIGLALFLCWLLAAILSHRFLAPMVALEVSDGDALLGFFATVFLLSVIIYVCYFIGFEVFWQGQTPGKRWVKIRVVQANGKPVGWMQAGLRTLLRPIDDFCFVGLFCIFFSQREQRLGDRFAGTIVVQEAQPLPQTPNISPVAQQLATELPSLTNLSRLQPNDIAVIHAYLQRRDEMATQPRRDLSLKLAREIRAIVRLAEIPTGLTSDQFLEAVYSAYQQQSME